MPVLTFKDQGGNQIKVNSPDGSIPSESELDGLFKQSYMAKNKSNPDMQGGANAPALVKARGDVSKLQGQNTNLDTQSGIVNSAANATWPVSLMMQKGLNGNTKRPSTDSGGSKMLADVGTMANPLTGEALKLIGKSIGITGKAIGDMAKYSNPKNVGALAKDVDNSLLASHTKVVDNYGSEYERVIGKSDKNINLSDTVKKLSEEEGNPLQNPKFANTPVAKLLENMSNKVDKGEALDDISVKNANYIQKAIKNIPSIKTKLEKGYKTGFHNVDWTNEERIALKFANDVKSKVIDVEPELSDLNKEYGSFMNNYKTIRGSFGTKANGGTAALMSKFSDLEKTNPNFTDAIKSVIPNAANKMKEFSNTLKQYNVLKKLGLWGAAAAGGGSLAKKGFDLTH